MRNLTIGLIIGLSLSTAYAAPALDELVLDLTKLVSSVQQSVIENRLALCDLGSDHFDCDKLREMLKDK